MSTFSERPCESRMGSVWFVEGGSGAGVRVVSLEAAQIAVRMRVGFREKAERRLGFRVVQRWMKGFVSRPLGLMVLVALAGSG